LGLVFSGVNDTVTCVMDCIINRDFSWNLWGVQQALDLCLISVSGGLACVEFFIGVVRAARAARVAGTVLRTVSSCIRTTQTIATKAFSRIKSKISEVKSFILESEINEGVSSQIDEKLMSNEHMQRMIKIDIENNNTHYQDMIRSFIRSHSYEKQPADVAELVAHTVAQLGGSAQTDAENAQTASVIKRSVSRLLEFVPEFLRRVEENIESVAKNDCLETDDSGLQSSSVVSGDLNDEWKIVAEAPCAMMEDTANQRSTVEETMLQFTKCLARDISYSICRDIRSSLNDEDGAHEDMKNSFNKLVDEKSRMLDSKASSISGSVSVRSLPYWDLADEKASKMMKQLDEGECMLYYMEAVSSEIERPIHIHDANESLITIIAPSKGGNPVRLRFEENSEDFPNGRYTLMKNIDALFENTSSSWGFDAIATQLDQGHPLRNNGHGLRNKVVQRLEMTREDFVVALHDLIIFEKYRQMSVPAEANAPISSSTAT